MRRSATALCAALLVLIFAQRESAAQILCEQHPGCATYPGGSIGDGGSGSITDPNAGGSDPLPTFNIDEQFASFGGDGFASDSLIIGDLLNPRTIIQGRSVVTPGGTSRYKMAENQNPIPRDRLFYNYSHFHNAVDDNVGTEFDINRHTFGIEKTFLSDMVSFETRIPFARTLASMQNVGFGQPFIEGTEFGDIAYAGKLLIVNGSLIKVSAGFAGSIPTAEDVYINQNGNVTMLKNEAWHLGPFIGAVFQPGSRLVISSVIQMDFDLNGNEFYDSATNTMGQFQDQNLFMATVSGAYWLTQNNNDAFVSGLAGILELHYTTSTVEGDFITPGGYSNERNNAIISTEGATTNILNLTGGIQMLLGPQNSLVIGAGVPLRDNKVQDKLFDTEILLQYNRFY